MISSREVEVVIIATVQLPHQTSVPEANRTLSNIMPNVLREIGYVPKLTIDIRELEEDV